ncbi:M14 family metallopeptidase [Portibacter lacus]|uniref:Peptidase M14 n=1 Tax=Portibacter lacus TaxID=1099794 RepID=A0AA37SWK5_9BACT|nr:M14 family metallopeptidase [Portibacter lacus]GLR19203.1 peptidase M14 [Portibacter lacus]
MNFHKFAVLITGLFVLACTAHAQTLPPNDFLPHIIGDEFTPHHLLVDYMYHVAEENDNVLITEYGRTNQKRPLLNLVISSQENIDNIDKIRLNNLHRAGLPEGKSFPEVDHITVVWLSFSVHGNEAAGSESSMPVIYELVTGANPEVKKWLENTVVIYDPSINPDGYSRYTHWHRNVAEKNKNTSAEDREHSEPWPGGRVNHYLFDLNRDWAWQTQIESQQRMKVYNMWMPQVHVDFHEMGSESPYYFAPAAAPFHNYITKWQNDFQTTIGKNHAKYFDKKGWLYFTKEVFDLFYPSYGDTYPIFNGAIGMTYEQGGGPRGGRAIDMANGEVLTLQDRVQHHYTTALSTIEAASNNADELIKEFKNFYAQPAPGRFKSYIIKGENREKANELASLLDRQGIKYMWTSAGGSGKGFNFQSGREGTFNIEERDLVISTDQPKKTLIQVLLDPESVLQDSLTYDITAWALPYAYGLQAYASTSIIRADSLKMKSEMSAKEDDYYAIVIGWESLEDAKLIAQLHKKEVTMRLSSIPFSIEGKKFDRNSVIITKADNKSYANSLLKLVKDAGAEADDYKIVKTGFADSGADLGSSKMSLLKEPKVLVLSGEKTSPNSFGQVWHYFEQVLDYPLTIVDSDRLSRVDMSKYNVLVMTDGWYGFSSNELDEIKDWVRDGGKLLSLGSANRSFADKDGFALKEFATDEEKKEVDEEKEQAELVDRFHSYEGAERRRIVNNVPGAIFQVNMDKTHPLSYGIGAKYYSLKTSSLNYRPLKGAYNVGVIANDALTIGFTGSEAKKKLIGSVDYAVESMGRGSIVYMIDNPLFRGFWKEGQLLFANALFLVD